MKVYVCWSVPDYIGIDIEAIFLKEEDAINFVSEWKKTHEGYVVSDYDVFEVK